MSRRMRTMAVLALGAILWPSAGAFAAGRWANLDEAHRLSGAALTERELAGKAVLVAEWGPGADGGLLPRLGEIAKAFDAKSYAVLGSYRSSEGLDAARAAVAGIAFPVYADAGLAANEPGNGGRLPYLYVVGPRGRVTYAGRGEREATEALVEAISSVGAPLSLYGGVPLVKFKSMKRQLVLGKSIASAVRRLEREAKGRNPQMAGEARQILAAIDEARADVREEISVLKEARPEEALRLIRLFQKTWPKDGEAYNEDVSQLTAAAAEARKQAAAAKKAAAEGKGK